MWISPKSGRPVFGHTEVNSGQLFAMRYSRSGRGLGNVSIVELGICKNSSMRKNGGFARAVFDSGKKGALRYAGFSEKNRDCCCARDGRGGEHHSAPRG